jgi:hypothetical protein
METDMNGFPLEAGMIEVYQSRLSEANLWYNKLINISAMDDHWGVARLISLRSALKQQKDYQRGQQPESPTLPDGIRVA